MNIYQQILSDLEQNQTIILQTELKGMEGAIGKGMERFLQREQEGAVNLGKPSYQINGDPKVHILREPFYPKDRLIVLGGGHIALPLVEFAAKTGFCVIVADDRPSFANRARFPLANQVLCESFNQVFDTIQITPRDYVVIITRGHRHDTDCLRQVLKGEESIYVGMIGSRRRVGAVKELLIKEGYEEERLERICTPIGLSIGAITPEEIAISILAQIIQRKRLGNRNQTLANNSDIDYVVLNYLAQSNQEPKCVVTVMSSRGSVPRGAGAKMIVFPTGVILGSIGGGCSEAAIIRDAIQLIGSQRYRIQTIDMTNDTAQSEGMVCGGTMEVLLEDA
jgi:xanthine dehydrogenase accessory factor